MAYILRIKDKETGVLLSKLFGKRGKCRRRCPFHAVTEEVTPRFIEKFCLRADYGLICFP